MASVCLIGIDAISAERIVALLKTRGHRVEPALPHGASLPLDTVDVVFVGGDPDQYLPVLEQARKRSRILSVIIIGEHRSTTQWLDALEAGARDYLATPLNDNDILWAMNLHIPQPIAVRKQPPTRHDVLQILDAEVDGALQRFNEASSHFRELVADIPSGIPQPDGALRIQKAGRAQRTASDQVQKALRRRDDFLVDAIIPEDLIR